MIIRNLIIVVLTLCSSHCSFSQGNIQRLKITSSKTTSLVFQYPIINVDRGSDDVIAQKVREAENTLQIKAARENFPETNLTVITADGKLHHFYLNYADKPEKQTFHLDSTAMDVDFTNDVNLKVYERKVDKILARVSQGSLQRSRKHRIKVSLNGIYIDGGEVFYDVTIRNRSNIRYDIQSLRFFIRDKKKAKRTASQEIELTPSYASDKGQRVNGRVSLRVVYVLDKFTIPDAKRLDIELFEKNGGRNLKLSIDNQTIVKAEKLPK
jgi:conjugative transposon TraN protein